MASQMHQRCSDGRKFSLQLVSYFAGPTIQDIERNFPPAYRHRLPPHLASLPIAPDPFTLRALPSDWTRFVDLNTGRVHYKKDVSFAAAAEAMGENGCSSPQLDSKPTRTILPPLINLHLPDSPTESMSASSSLSPTSPQISCVSSEGAEVTDTEVVRSSSSPPEVTSMVLKGCRCCLIYILLKEEQEPKCPKCKNTDLVDFLDENTKNNNNNSNKKIKKE